MLLDSYELSIKLHPFFAFKINGLTDYINSCNYNWPYSIIHMQIIISIISVILSLLNFNFFWSLSYFPGF